MPWLDCQCVSLFNGIFGVLMFRSLRDRKVERRAFDSGIPIENAMNIFHFWWCLHKYMIWIRTLGYYSFAIAHGNKSGVPRISSDLCNVRECVCLYFIRYYNILYCFLSMSPIRLHSLIYSIVLHYVPNLCARPGRSMCFSRFTAHSIFSVWFNFFFNSLSFSFFLFLFRSLSLDETFSFSHFCMSCKYSRHSMPYLFTKADVRVHKLNCERSEMWCTLRRFNANAYTYHWNIDDIQRKACTMLVHTQWPVTIFGFCFVHFQLRRRSRLLEILL